MPYLPLPQKFLEYDATPGLGSQKVVSAWFKPASGEQNIRVPIPFKGVLRQIQAFVTESISLTDVKVELTAASGTALCSLTISESSGVGTIDAASESTGLTNKNLLLIDNDFLNVEISGSGATGSFMMYFLFEAADAMPLMLMS